MFNMVLFIPVGNICCNDSNKVSETKSIISVDVGVGVSFRLFLNVPKQYFMFSTASIVYSLIDKISSISMGSSI